MTSRYCKACTDFHELDEPWPMSCLSHFGSQSSRSIQIIKDIDPYKAVAVDVATGDRPRIGSRREHREFLRRNKYVEVGNEMPKQRPTDYVDINPREIVDTIDKLRSERGR